MTDVSEEHRKQIEYLTELMERQEDLHEDLEPYLEEDGPLGPMLRHPLVYEIICPPMRYAWCNERYRVKLEYCEKAIEEQKWSSYLYMHERPYRLDAFEHIEGFLLPDEYWDLLGGIWTDSENIRQNEARWRRCLTAEIEGREHMMSEEEQAALAHDYDDVIPVFRGFSYRGRERGLSWTANSVVAKWFARRFARDGEPQYVASGHVNKSDVLAFFDGRSEYEMVVLPEHVMDMEITQL